MTLRMIRMALAAALVCLSASATVAQTTTSTETKRFRVIAVDGNNLVVALPEGTREMTVPDDFRFTVDGKQLSVRELQPGMSGTATVTTRTTLTPVTVTEVKDGTVLYTTGMSIIVRTGNETKMFTQSDIDKRNIKIMRGGKPAQISDFRQNDRLTATIVTTMPPKVMTEKEVQATLAKAAPAAAAPTTSAATGAPAARPAAAPAPSSASAGASSPAPTLPKTASPLPLLGLAGLLSLTAGFGLTAARRRRATR
jgi:LPXTG-motif cell wall-anchored protein